MMFVEVENYLLVQFLHKRLHVHHIYSQKLQRMLHYKLASNWAHSHAWGSFIQFVGDDWSSTSFPSLALGSNLNPNGLLYLMSNHPLNHVVLCIINVLPYQMHIGISSLPRFKDEMRIANLFNSWFLKFITHDKIVTLVCRLNFKHPLGVSYDLGIHLPPHLRAPHHSLALQ